MYINDNLLNWEDIGRQYLDKYSGGSYRTTVSDVNRIIEFMKQDRPGKEIERINAIDLEEDISKHVSKEDDPLKSKNSVFKYISRWRLFLEFLRVEMRIISSEMFLTEINDIKKFKNDIAKKFNLSDEESSECYDVDLLLNVLYKIEEKLNQYATDDQTYRLVQQSIFIQLTLQDCREFRLLI